MPAGDPRRGGSELLCAIPLHRAGNYNMIIILTKTNKKKGLYNGFILKRESGRACQVHREMSEGLIFFF